MWGLGGLVIASILVGTLAQAGKGRTGAVWGLLSFGIGFVWWLFMGVAVQVAETRRPGGYEFPWIVDLTFALFVGVPVLVVMGLIVLTLPNKKSPKR